MTKLTQAAFDQAVEFILDNGTNLHGARCRFHFENGNAHDVIDALSCYQNLDGGFGHGLEGDLRTKNSSVLCTTVALQILKEIGAEPEHSMITGAMDYLVRQYRHRNWSLITPECNDAPHAPWWKYEHQCSRQFRANPGAEILANLRTYPSMMCGTTRSNLAARALSHLETEELDMHDLICYQRFYDTADVELQSQMLPQLLRWAFEIVKVDEHDWEEYCLTPLDLVQHPDSPFADFFGEYLENNFEFQIRQQRQDGSWQPSWSWGSEYPATWQVVEPELSAEVTLKFLRQLQAFNMLT
ncbi:MAG TPA: hypothetical protein DCM54_12250 [Gammaproteobacteria bacterium]|nr:hypothetical protein [Gammaproteobacteria bacterium]